MTIIPDSENNQDVYYFNVSKNDEGKRLDVFVSQCINTISRSYSAQLVNSGNVLVNKCSKKNGYKVKEGDNICCNLPVPKPVSILPQNIDINIIFQNKNYMIINKVAGMVVHPAPGHYDDTLVNALMWHCTDLERIGSEIRPGIVHRLDKDTSGILIVAKNSFSHKYFSDLFKNRNIQKEYHALLAGDVKQDHGKIELPIGRHPHDRKKMSVSSRRPRNAETQWKVLERFGSATLVSFKIKTGRTHQIRVHSKAIGHPVVGDNVYGFRKKKGPKLIEEAKRQMLHAVKISFVDPETSEQVSFNAPYHYDMKLMIDKLRN